MVVIASGVEQEPVVAAVVDMQAVVVVAVARNREQEAAGHIVAGMGPEIADTAVAPQTSEEQQRKGLSMVDTESAIARRAFDSKRKVVDIVAVAVQTGIPEERAAAADQSYVCAGAAVSQVAGRCSGVAVGTRASTGSAALVVVVENTPGSGPCPDTR